MYCKAEIIIIATVIIVTGLHAVRRQNLQGRSLWKEEISIRGHIFKIQPMENIMHDKNLIYTAPIIDIKH